MGGAAVSKSPVSRMCEETNERVKPCLDSPREGDWLYNWPDATDVKVRCNHRIVSVATIVAVGATISAETWLIKPCPGVQPVNPQVHFTAKACIYLGNQNYSLSIAN